MLLRSLTKHVKDQNWFAVALDFFIVVMGVFIGIQVANWNEARFTSQEANTTKISLISDLKSDRDVYTVRRKFYLEVKQAITNTERIFDTQLPPTIEAQWRFVEDAQHAGAMWPFKPSGQVYDQLLSSGKLALVSNDIIQRQMRDYYQDAALEAGVTFKFDSAYRSHARRLIDWKLYDFKDKNCNQVVGADSSDIISLKQNYLPNCPFPTELAAEIAKSAEDIHAAQGLHRDANSLAAQITSLLSYLEYLDDEAKTLIADLEKQ